MPDVRVRFVGESNLGQTYKKELSYLESFVKDVKQANQKALQAAVGPDINRTAYDRKGNYLGLAAGTTVAGTAKVELDKQNNVIRSTIDLYKQLSNGVQQFIGTQKDYLGALDTVTKAEDGLLAARQKAFGDAQQFRQQYNTTKQTLSDITDFINRETRARVDAIGVTKAQTQADLDAARARRDTIRSNLETYRSIDPTTLPKREAADLVRTRQQAEASLGLVEAEIQSLVKQRDLLTKQIRGERAAGAADLATNPVAVQARKELDALKVLKTGVFAEARKTINEAKAEVAKAYTAPLQIPETFKTIAKESPQLANRLIRGGLGGGATNREDFARNLFTSGAAENLQVTKDLTREVTRVTSSFTDQSGVLRTLTAEYDKSGRVITRFGAQQKGLGSVLTSLRRDFEKVLEFAVATTVVFGAFQKTRETITTINELDKSLRQFTITSQFSRQESLAFFDDLAKIGIATATPLSEIVKASDDIALAVRKAGQSTQDYRTDILALAEAVGILTNLSGIDTVRATDLLVSSMKQLGLEATDVIDVLNKVTAVAGGQSSAIADIIQGLGVMAEAGKQAGLSIDQQIAAVQTLSQVTSKSPAEVATAFKNLVGSLDSRAATKALAQYNISLRDEEGNLKNILEVYAQVNEARQQGIIPEADVKGLVKALAGGPRRAPDAAALLGAIEDIQEVTGRSVRATNEALIANAQILGSTQAKLVQLQAAFDNFAFGKFAEALNVAAGSVFDVLNGILALLDLVPTNMYVLVLGVTALGVAAKILTSTFGLLVGSMKNVRDGLREITQGSQLARVGLVETNSRAAQAVAQNRTSGGQFAPGFIGGTNQTSRRRAALSAISRSPFTSTIGASLLGAGVAAATQQDLRGIASSALTTAGAFAAFAQPVPMVKALGAAMLIVGAGLELLVPKQRAVKDVTAETSQAILAQISRYKELQAQIDSINDQQDGLSAKLNNLSSIQNRTVAEQAALISSQQQYAENAVSLIDLNLQLGQSYDELNAAISGVPQYETKLLNSSFADSLDKIVEEATRSVLKATNPNFPVPEDFAAPPITVRSFAPVQGTSTVDFAEAPPSATGVPIPTTIKPQLDLTELKDNSALVTQLFDETGRSLKAAFDPSASNIKLINDALDEQIDLLGRDYVANAKNSAQALRAQSNQLATSQQIVAAYTAQIEATKNLGLLDANRANQLQGTLDLYQKFNLLAAQLAGAGDIAGADRLAQAATRTLLVPGETGLGAVRESISKDEALALGRQYFAAAKETVPGLEGLDLTDEAKMLELIRNLLIQTRVEVRGFTEDAIKIEQASEAYQEFQGELEKLVSSGIEGLVGESANLRGRFVSGEIDTAEYSELNGVIQELIKTWNDVGDAADAAGASVVDFPSFFGDSLDEISGLENAQSLSAADLIANILELGQTYIKTDEDAKTFRESLLGLFQTMQAISSVEKTVLELGIDMPQDFRDLPAVLDAIAEDQERIRSLTGEAAFEPSQLRGLADAYREALGMGDQLAGELAGVTDAAIDGAAAFDAYKASIDDALGSVLSGLASESAQLQSRLLGGDIEAGDYAEIRSQIDAMVASLGRMGEAATAAGIDMSDAGDLIGDQLVKIAGLEDAQSLSTDQLISRLFSLAQTYGLTGDQVVILAGKMQNLIQAIEVISKIKAQFNISANVDVAGAIKALKAIRSTIAATNVFGGIIGAAIDSQLSVYDNAIRQLEEAQTSISSTATAINNLYQSGQGTGLGQPPKKSSKTSKGPDVSTIDLPDEIANAANRDTLIQQAIKNALKLQAQIPGASKEAQDDIVELLKGTQRILEVRGVKDDLLRKALEELAEIEKKRLEFETKADTIRRIRVGSPSFAALANVPLNTQTGVSVGGPSGPVTVNLNINGQVLTPAQFQQLADQIGAAIKKQLSA